MGSHRTATSLAHLARSEHTDAIARLDIIVIVLAGSLIILATWEWMRRQ